jgi:hypothetical protein
MSQGLPEDLGLFDGAPGTTLMGVCQELTVNKVKLGIEAVLVQLVAPGGAAETKRTAN